ncbi:hypothetical protein [Niastella sp. OAS944]|uniref:hypothetical protein n=1 Tax=Niastella sp. OAS944 TaxID=2664089 RepID=UPI0034820DE2|nr:hypothetical protein [Chitinophagaceae bacterium OAS944]
MKYFLIQLLIVVTIFYSCQQPSSSNISRKDFKDKIFDIVLSENNINQEYCFEKIDSINNTKYCLVNIGSIKTKHTEYVFILNTVLSGSKSVMANSYINIFDLKGNKVGYYYAGGAFQNLPKIQGSNLIFQNNINCGRSTSISFKDSIPQSIFIQCGDIEGKMYGDVYKFERYR